MKKTISKAFCLLIYMGLFAFQLPDGFAQQNVGIGIVTPDASAILDLTSTDKGMLAPRMSTVQRSAIIAPATGLLVYDTDFSQFWYFDGAIWVPVSAGAMGPTGPTGTAGVAGAIGPTGDPGTQGATGPTGTPGTPGTPGTIGAQGPTGPAGPVGCASANYVIKSNGGAATCSIIYDDGANVGISNAAPTQKLDVTGNVRFSGALMPNNLAGNAGQVLRSAGAGVAPTWAGAITASDIFSVESTSSINLTAAWQIIPGETITINGLATGDRVVINYSGNALMTTINYGTVDVAAFVNGAMIAIGGYVRVTLDYSVAWIAWQNFSSIARYTIPAAGNYTFDVRALLSSGSGTISVGGTSLQATEGVLIIYVLKN